MDDITFSNLIKGQLFMDPKPQVPRKTMRETIEVEVILASKSHTFKAKLIDCSPTVMRIDQNISNTVQEACTVIIKTTPPIEAVCFPIIGDKEFKDGHWNRLRIKSMSCFDKLFNFVRKSAA